MSRHESRAQDNDNDKTPQTRVMLSRPLLHDKTVSGAQNGQAEPLRRVQEHATISIAFVREELPSGIVYTRRHPNSPCVHVDLQTDYEPPKRLFWAYHCLPDVWDGLSIIDFAGLVNGVLDDALEYLEDLPESHDSDCCTPPDRGRLPMMPPEHLSILAEVLVMTDDKTKGGAPNDPLQTSAIYRGLEQRAHKLRDALGLRGVVIPLLDNPTGDGYAVLAYAEGSKLVPCRWTEIPPSPPVTPEILSNDGVPSIRQDEVAHLPRKPKFAWNPGRDLYDHGNNAIFNRTFHDAYDAVRDPSPKRDRIEQTAAFKEWARDRLERECAMDGDLSKAYREFLLHDF